MAYFNGNRVFIKTNVVCDTDASYRAGQRSMAVLETTKGNPAICDYVHPAEHELAIRLETRNILPYPYPHSNRTHNGITYTDNGDGTITLNGTATADSNFGVRLNQLVPNLIIGETYRLSGCPAGGSVSTYYLRHGWTGHNETGDGLVLANVTEKFFNTLRIEVKAGTVCENVVFRPMLTHGSKKYEYTPYLTNFSGVTIKRYGEDLTAEDFTEYQANADGTVKGIISLSPVTTLAADGVIINAEYWLDAGKKIAHMETAMLDLGGSL